ncbi:unnamed protein product [Echinostoma caproni]|uniref:Uncharacterized protein n=1 Tax=Echinostoma caproni TaxID=27848 RepID=A0A183B7G7_9TREM|nr:unnamed protein product [Echinostoma caproni]
MYRALSPAELRWLPPIPSSLPSSYPIKSRISDSSSLDITLPLYCSENPPLIVICLRFGAPGVRLAKLREVIATRLLPRHSTPSSLASSPHGSCFSDKWTVSGSGFPGATASAGGTRPRANSLIPPEDTLMRLTQCLTCLSTGYAWQPCNAFRLDEHVLPVPAVCLPSSVEKTARTSSSQCNQPESLRDRPVPVRAESVVSAISRLPFLLHRPLWQVYLLEQYQDVSLG